MRVLLGINSLLAFLAELGGLAAFAVWAAGLPIATGWRVLLAVATPLAAAAIWGLFCAPRAAVELPGMAVAAIKLLLLGCAVVALVAAGHPWWALVLAVVAIGSSLIVTRLGTGLAAAAAPARPGPAGPTEVRGCK